MFPALRPDDIFPRSEKDHEVCMCIHNENIELLIDELNNISSLNKLAVTIQVKSLSTVSLI